MAKKSSKTPRRTSPSKTHGVINGAGEVVEQPIVSTIRENYMPYATVSYTHLTLPTT